MAIRFAPSGGTKVNIAGSIFGYRSQVITSLC